MLVRLSKSHERTVDHSLHEVQKSYAIKSHEWQNFGNSVLESNSGQ